MSNEDPILFDRSETRMAREIFGDHDLSFRGDANTHEIFQGRAEYSNKAVFRAARWLRSYDFTVERNMLKIAPDFESRHDYSDEGDLYIVGGKFKKKVRVEVKKSEYPWPKGRIITYPGPIYGIPGFAICSDHSYDQADPKPYMYLWFNKFFDQLAIIKCDTFDEWWKDWLPDKKLGDKVVWQKKYFIKPDKIKIIRGKF